MASDSAIDRAFTEGLNETYRIYNMKRFEEYVAKIRELLDDYAIPRYHRIKALIMLGAILSDPKEVNQCLVDAEFVWKVVRRGNPKSRDAVVDRHMTEIRQALDDFQKALKERKSKDCRVHTGNENPGLSFKYDDVEKVRQVMKNLAVGDDATDNDKMEE
jgi:hypothetical protein